MLEGLDPAQRTAATAPLGPLRILAGPGAGKTRTIVARIEHLVTSGQVEAGHVLALSHTTKAAGELRDRLSRIPAQASAVRDVASSTIHAAAWRQVRHLWTLAGYTGAPRLLTSVYSPVRKAADHTLGRRVEQAELLDLVAEIDWARARLLTPQRYADTAADLGRTAPTGSFSDVARIWEKYATLKDMDGYLDFADVLACATVMLDVADVAQRVRDRWRVLFVDEYQDVDPAQQALIDAWLGTRDTLTVVADPNQAIFGFKGADPTLLDQFTQRYPRAVTVELSANYRSSPQIVDWVNRARVSKNEPLTGLRGDGPEPRIERCYDEKSEITVMIRQIQGWIRAGVDLSEISVLYRFNATAARVEAALAAAGVPYHTLGTGRFFERPEVRAALDHLAVIARDTPTLDAPTSMLRAATLCGYDPLTIPDGAGAVRQRYESLHALVTLTAQHLHAADATGLVAEMTRRIREAHEPNPGGVSVGTIHAAKGLEWDAVWVVGLVEGQLPSAYAKTPAALKEEQHAFYVAISRARTHLVVSSAGKRSNNWTQKPSRFLDLLEPRVGTTSTRAGMRTGSGHTINSKDLSPGMARKLEEVGTCAKCKGKLRGAGAWASRRCSPECLPDAGKAAYAGVSAWRETRAKTIGVPVSAIATDRSLFTYVCTGNLDAAGLHDTTGIPPVALNPCYSQ
jgi:DNA helicase II / ATP-dependent DNA helicase PcrA